MLPTVTPDPRLTPALPRVLRGEATPCRIAASALDWTEPAQAGDAAAQCQSCPLATACLVAALHDHAAYRAADPADGLYGVYGGVWFSPGHCPTSPRTRVAWSDVEARG